MAKVNADDLLRVFCGCDPVARARFSLDSLALSLAATQTLRCKPLPACTMDSAWFANGKHCTVDRFVQRG